MKDNRDHKSVVEIITKIEENFDVNSLRYHNLHIWPWIRLSIWTQLNNPQNNYLTAKSSTVNYYLDEQAIRMKILILHFFPVLKTTRINRTGNFITGISIRLLISLKRKLVLSKLNFSIHKQKKQFQDLKTPLS